MNRRTLLKTMLSLPVAAALGGCRREPNPAPSTSPASPGGTLRVALHGPFAVVIDKARQFRIQAFVPFDEHRKHEFRLLTHTQLQANERGEGKDNSYQFELLEEGLEVNGRQPYTDHGFDDFNVRVGAWQPTPKNYFVSIALPAPNLITFSPRMVYNVLFEDGKMGTMPIDHILEYRVRDLSKVQIRSPQLGNILPLSCSDLHKVYEKSLGREMTDDVAPPPVQAGGAGQELTRCSDSDVSSFFFGVGLPLSAYNDRSAADAHAIKFFNESVLASFPNAPDLKKKRLQAVDVPPCRPVGDIFTAPTLVPAVQRYPVTAPYLRPAASIEDCRTGGLIGTTS